MKQQIKEFIKLFVPRAVLKSWETRQHLKSLEHWERNGRPVPPPHMVKQRTIAEYQKKHGYRILIETGTFMGTMVEAQKTNFEKVISIEVSEELYHKATKRFANDQNVTIVQGDSGKVLPKILSGINEPVIFWLDGHYSGGITGKGEKECPIYEELDSIFKSRDMKHILLIDDARLFIGEKDYPTISELTEYVRRRNENYKVEVKDDIIRFVA